jgi:hypothetical protein
MKKICIELLSKFVSRSARVALVLLVSASKLLSQEIEWQNTIGGGQDDQLYSIQQTADGGYILGGRSRSNISGDKTENCSAIGDYWIVKTDDMGNIQWQNTISGAWGDDVLKSIQQTTDGGYIIGGYSNSSISGDKTENCIGSFDYWIVKISGTGTIQWENTIGGDSDDYLSSIKQTYRWRLYFRWISLSQAFPVIKLKIVWGSMIIG